jgi:hypothetical protein
MNLHDLTQIKPRTTGRCSSWDTSGRNQDFRIIPPGESLVMADIQGPAQITHIWMTQAKHYRDCLVKITYDDLSFPSVLVPLGDFFCLGHAMVNSFDSYLFNASTYFAYQFEKPVALNAYVPMPFARRAVVELVNESAEDHLVYYYIDYETLSTFQPTQLYFHAEFRRANPFGGWGAQIRPNTPPADITNLGRLAYENNYVILETKGTGNYIGCNLSVTNFSGDWWGEGDDMIWVDGYKWPPDLHGTGSEDYLGHAGGMQPEAHLRNGSSIFEGYTIATPELSLWRGESGYQTSYVFHLENPIRFDKDIKVTIEHGHGNHLANEMSSTAYWYAQAPAPAVPVPPVQQRQPVLRDNRGRWITDPDNQCPGKAVPINDEMQQMRDKHKEGTR